MQPSAGRRLITLLTGEVCAMRNQFQANALIHKRTVRAASSCSAENIVCGSLRAVRVVPHRQRSSTAVNTATNAPVVVMVPGMHHEAWYFRGLQEEIAARGFESVSFTLPKSRLLTAAPTDFGRLADLRSAMDALQLERPVMLGHSQGGLLTQMYADLVDPTMPERQRLGGVVLSATGALGQKRPFFDLVMQLASLLPFSALAYVGRTGKYRTPEDMAKLFLLPTTTHTTVAGADNGRCADDSSTEITADRGISVAQYWERLNAADCSSFGEGLTTYMHALYSRWAFWNPQTLKVPTLVVSADNDVLYRRVHAEWLLQHHCKVAELLTVANQAHCLADPGWEDTYARPVADWLDKLPR